MTSEFLTYFNGQMIPDSEVKLHYSDSGVSFGHTVTDSARTFAHQPFKLEAHIERFFASMKAVRIDPGMSSADMVHLTLDVLAANKSLMDAEMDVWLTQTATGGPLLRTIGGWEFGTPTLIINAAPLDFKSYAHLYDSGVHAISPSTRHIPSQSLDAKIKHRNRLFMSLAEFEVKEVDPEGFSILLDIHGNLSENKGANFFIVKDGVLKTPTTRNALAGISRATVLELAESLGLPAVEEDLQPYHVVTADEAFFCSTSYCIMPATRFNGHTVGDGQVGPITRKLLQSWSQLVEVDIIAQAKRHAR